MKRSLTFPILTLTIIAVILILTIPIVTNLLDTNMKENTTTLTSNTTPNSTIIDIELYINKEKGEKTFDLGNITIPADYIIARPSIINREGNFNITLSGELTLNSSSHTYRIPMPCILNIGEQCYRILILIPGYDIPLNIKKDTYHTTLTLTWTAKGTGKLHIRLTLQYSDNPNKTSINIIGIKPKNTDGWITTPNSTKTYAMLINTTSQTSTLAWIWIFDPNNLNSGKLTLKITDKNSGYTLAETHINAFRDNTYWSVLVEIKTPPEGKYRITCILENNIMMAIDIP